MKKALSPATRSRIYHLRTQRVLTTTSGLQDGAAFNSCSGGDMRNINTLLLAETPAVTLTASRWLDFKKISRTTYVTNATNNVVFLTAYYFTARRDTDITAGAPTEFLNNPYDAWVQGLVNQGMAADFYTNPFVTPFESNDFTRLFKVFKTKKKKLKAGAFTSFHVSKRNVRIGYNDFQDAQATMIANKTFGILLLYHGGLASVTTGTTGTMSLCKLITSDVETYVLRNSADYMPDKQISFMSGTYSTDPAFLINDNGIGSNTAVAVAS